MPEIFRVGLTPDFRRADGTMSHGDIGLGILSEAANVEWEVMEGGIAPLTLDQIRGYDAILALSPPVRAEALDGNERLAIVARFGVGYDSVDVDACTRNGVLLTITPDGVRRPVATAAITLVLALTHKLLIKDRLTRAGRWAEKGDYMGIGVAGRTLGLIGLGNIGREMLRLAAPFEMRHLAHDPYATRESAAAAGAQLVDLDVLLAESDYVCICCALTKETLHLIDAERLARMKPSAYLINVARGPIVDQVALAEALSAGRIQGAGIDVFENEPVDPEDPLLKLENTIVTPHAIAWTDECFLGNGRSACQSIVDVATGRVPKNVVNRPALESPLLRAKLERFAARV